MTQEEKLKEAKRLYESANADQRYVLESLFPELKESEGERDERIRKKLIEVLNLDIKGAESQMQNCSGVDRTFEVEACKKGIAWLEKQGEQKPITHKYNVGATIYYNSFGETKSMVVANVVDIGNGNPMYEDTDGNAVFEKDIIEPKTADKVVPKFKVGDWVCHTVYKKPLLIVEDLGEGDFRTEPESIITAKEFREGFYRLWTIKDAKDGDVLCTYECDKPKIVFILKGTPKKHYALSYHCYYNIMYPHFASDSEKGCLAPNNEDVKPSTKEQRDTLERAMHNAGYEWDADKKELKKIEQKPTWGEEDEEIYRKCICAMRASACGFPEEEKFVEQVDNWLKSLKDRVQPQKTWKPSDEQMDALHYVTNFDYGGHKATLVSLYEQLKKLKA